MKYVWKCISIRKKREVNSVTSCVVGTEGVPSLEPRHIGCLFVGWFLDVPATCKCISGTDMLRQFYVLPHSILTPSQPVPALTL